MNKTEGPKQVSQQRIRSHRPKQVSQQRIRSARPEVGESYF